MRCAKVIGRTGPAAAGAQYICKCALAYILGAHPPRHPFFLSLLRVSVTGVFTTFCLLSCFDVTFAATTNFAAKRERKEVAIEKPLSTLTVGEKLVFGVYWMGIYVGDGTLEVKEKVIVRGREAFHVVATAKTNDFLTKIYPIYDELHSFIDAEKFCSLEFRRNVREGRYRADETVIYDYEKKKAFYESALNKSKKEADLPAEVHDPLSAFYWFRLQEIKSKDSLRTVVNSREKNVDLEIQILGQQTKELKGKRVIETVLVEPKTRYKDVLADRGRAWVYFGVDSRRVPVWITIKSPFGTVNGVLKTDQH